MKITIEPTTEMFDAPINGQHIPTRVWFGKTEGGVEVEVYVLSIVPQGDEAAYSRFKAELPPFMKPSRELYDINEQQARQFEERSRRLHETHWRARKRWVGDV